MKSICLLATALICFNAATAQLVVSDPALEVLGGVNKVTLGMQLEEAVKQTTQLAESYKTIKQAADVYYKISDGLRTAGTIKGLLRDQAQLIAKCGQVLKSARKTKGATTRSIGLLQDNINTIVNNNQEALSLIQQLLEEKTFKMTDGDRLKMLTDIRKSTAEASNKLSALESSFQLVNSSRQMVANLYNK